jgi:hypothetical protein
MLVDGTKYWMVTPDGNKIVERTVIKRKGCYTCRYEGDYRLVLGPIEMGLKIGSILTQGKDTNDL